MIFFDHYRWQDMKKLHLHGMWGMYLNQLFRRIATSMYALFIPIFIWQTTGSMGRIFLFYLSQCITVVIMVYPLGLLIRRIGVDKALVLGSVFRALSLFLLILVKQHVNLLYFVPIIFGLMVPLEWVPFHYCAASLSKTTKNYGQASSLIEFFTQLGAAVGPFIGGLVITLWGFSWMYGLSMVFILFSAISPLFDDFAKEGMHFELKDIVNKFKDKGIVKHFVGHGLQMFDINAYGVVWPLILLATMGTVLKSGLFQSVTLLMILVILMWLSKHLDKGKYKVMYAGAGLSSLQWFIRFILNFPLGLALAELIRNIGNVLLWPPFNAIVYAKGVKKYKFEFFLTRTLIRNILAIIILLSFWGFNLIFKNINLFLVYFGVVSLLGFLLPKLFTRQIKRMQQKL